MPTASTRVQPPAGQTERRRAAFAPASYRESDHSIEVVWSVGAAGMRFDWLEGMYVEELSLRDGAVRLDRLNAGAPLLDSHQDTTLASVLGSVAPGSARVADGKGIARVRLAATPDVADTVAKIVDGHIRNCSVGYMVHQFTRTEKPGEHPHMLATDWEPVEISMVAVPFDAAAQVRSRSKDMPDVVEPIEEHEEDHRERGAGGNAPKLATIARIRALCSRTPDLSRGFERELVQEHCETPLPEATVLQRINDELCSQRRSPVIDARQGGADTQGSPGELRRRMAGALYARMSGRDPGDESREFMGASMIDMARGMMEARGERVRWENPSRIVQRMGQHTTSDFPTILGDASHRYLLDVLKDYPSPLRPIARQRTANDFRKLTIAKVSANPALLYVPENGEFKRGTVAESFETYKLNTYGRIFSISRQAIINDDLGAFTGVFAAWGRAGGELEATMLSGLVSGNGPTMQDNLTLYHATHGNLAAAGTAISVAALSSARQAMRMQKDIDGVTPLNIAPKFLVVGAAKETEAEQALATLAAANTGDANPFSGKLELVVDARLPGNGWRLFADPASWPVLEEARLAGQEDIFVDTRAGFDVDGVETKARLDIGAAAVDWRGTYLNPGN